MELEHQLSLLSVRGEPLRHHGTMTNVPFTAFDGSEMRVNFEVTDATRPILSVNKGADIGAMTIFKPCGGGKIIRDAAAIGKITNILDETEGFNDVHENGAYVLKTKTSQTSSRRYVQPVNSNNKLERALSQAAKEHEKKHTLWRPRSTRRTLTSATRSRDTTCKKKPTSRHSKSIRNTRRHIVRTERRARSA